LDPVVTVLPEQPAVASIAMQIVQPSPTDPARKASLAAELRRLGWVSVTITVLIFDGRAWQVHDSQASEANICRALILSQRKGAGIAARPPVELNSRSRTTRVPELHATYFQAPFAGFVPVQLFSLAFHAIGGWVAVGFLNEVVLW